MPISSRVAAAALFAATVPGAASALDYRVDEGRNVNLFTTAGPVAAHTVLRSGDAPRLLIAFPAGNSGTGLWFEPLAHRATWRVDAVPVPVTLADARGRPMYGVRFAVSIDATRLVPRRMLATSVRFLRDFEAIGRVPDSVAPAPHINAHAIELIRDRLDGAPGYRMTVTVTHGSIAGGALVAAVDGRIGVEVTAATGEPPLTPLPVADLLVDRAAADAPTQNALEFLSTRDKFLAGSWRFNTYFGRDTLMSVKLLMPALRPPAIEAGLNSVLARLADDGEVAHEEGIGEFAVVDRRAHGGAGDAPTLDYGMVDSGYMLAPVAAAYLLDRAGPAAARAWLEQRVGRVAQPGRTEAAGALLVRNLRLVTASARAFTAHPGKSTLVAIKPERPNGEWRDSEEGLGRGRFPYDVNAVLVPAALTATARLLASGLLDAYLTPVERSELAEARGMATVWAREAPPLFRVERPAAATQAAVRAYATAVGVPAGPALAALGNAPLRFHALSLNGDGSAVPIVNSDEGFAWLFGAPAAADLATDLEAVMRPFPAGLMTPVGLLVANPAQADRATQERFGRGAYHGTVVWSWQQALLAAGLTRQLERGDLPANLRGRLRAAQSTLWQAIAATRAYRSSELWSWDHDARGYHVVAFGAGRADADESNAAQLWSTVYLAVQPPR